MKALVFCFIPVLASLLMTSELCTEEPRTIPTREETNLRATHPVEFLASVLPPQKKKVDGWQRKGAYQRETAFEDIYGGFKIAEYAATGFFRLETEEGRHFLVTPAGHPFYIIAMNSVTPYYHQYNKAAFENKYKSDFTLWANLAVDRLQLLGFNTLAYKTSERMLRDMMKGNVWMMPFTVLIPFTEHNAMERSFFPDVFSQKFPAYADSVAKEYCQKLKDEPFLVGYFLGNELDFDLWVGDKIDWRSRWIRTLMKQEPGSPARKELAAIVRNTFGSVAKLNESFEQSKQQFNSFDEIGFDQLWPAFRKKIPQAVQIIENFNALIAERFYKVSTEAIKRYDPNHLILGSRFGTDAEAKVLKATKDYTDVVSINRYPQGGKFPSATFEKMYSNTQKPLFHTEFSFLLKGKDGSYPSAPSQEARGQYYEMQVMNVVEEDNIIGFGWHEWLDANDEMNFGVVDIHDDFYFELARDMIAANRAVKKRFVLILREKISRGE